VAITGTVCKHLLWFYAVAAITDMLLERLQYYCSRLTFAENHNILWGPAPLCVLICIMRSRANASRGGAVSRKSLELIIFRRDDVMWSNTTSHVVTLWRHYNSVHDELNIECARAYTKPRSLSKLTTWLRCCRLSDSLYVTLPRDYAGQELYCVRPFLSAHRVAAIVRRANRRVSTGWSVK